MVSRGCQIVVWIGRPPISIPSWCHHVSSNGSVSKPCTPVVHIKIAGKWMFIPLKMELIGIDPFPNDERICFKRILMIAHLCICICLT
jgi:hypothetical protein